MESGTGGLGHLAIQYAKVMGLQVCAVDIDDGTLAHATRLGADSVVNASDGDPVWAVKKGTDGGAHGVLITAPSLDAFKQGVGMARKRGTCALVGLPPGDQRDIPAPVARGRAVLPIPTQTSRRFRCIPAGDSDGSQPVIPAHSSHP